MPFLSDEEIDAVLARHDVALTANTCQTIREVVRLVAERAAQICEEIYLGRDNDNGSVCAAAIRQQIEEMSK